MAYTKISVQTWDKVPADADIQYVDDTRSSYLTHATLAGKTDGNFSVIDSPLVFSRVWIDQTAAQEWADFIIALGASVGCTVNVSINDIP